MYLLLLINLVLTIVIADYEVPIIYQHVNCHPKRRPLHTSSLEPAAIDQQNQDSTTSTQEYLAQFPDTHGASKDLNNVTQRTSIPNLSQYPLQPGVYRVINKQRGKYQNSPLSFTRMTGTVELDQGFLRKDPIWKISYPDPQSQAIVLQNRWSDGAFARNQWVIRAREH